jgi:hypothetical protein
MAGLSNYEKDKIALGIASYTVRCATLEHLKLQHADTATELLEQLVAKGEPTDLQGCAKMTSAVILENNWGWWGRSKFLSMVGAYLKQMGFAQAQINDFSMLVTYFAKNNINK